MTWVTKTEAEIRADVITIAKEETGLTNFKSTGVLRAFLEVFIRFVTMIYTGSINVIAKNTNLDTAVGTWLSFMGLLVGLARKTAKKTQGTFRCQAWGDGKITKGTWFINDALGLRFKVLEDTAFHADTFTVGVEAEFTGIDYNIPSGTSMRATRVVNGLDTISVPDTWIRSLGTEDETDESYRERIKARWRSLGEGNPPSRYILHALSVDGVASAKVIRTPRGWGSTDVIITAIDGLPSTELLERVRTALHDYELVCRDLLVRPPSVLQVAVSIEYTGDVSPEILEIAIHKYFVSLGIGGKLEIRKFYNEPWENLAIASLEIITPSRDITTSENSIVVPSDISITKKA